MAAGPGQLHGGWEMMDIDAGAANDFVEMLQKTECAYGKGKQKAALGDVVFGNRRVSKQVSYTQAISKCCFPIWPLVTDTPQYPQYSDASISSIS